MNTKPEVCPNGRRRSLIEEWLPIAEIGIESLRERTPMTPFPAPNRLHVWFVRRPLVASRAAVLASLIAILWESGVGSDVMKPIAAPIVGGMITSTIHVLILVPIFFLMMKRRSRLVGKELH